MSEWATVPRVLTDDMREACWRAQYLHAGATPREADVLTLRKISDPKQRENDEIGYRALLDAVALPSPPASTHEEDGG